MPQQAFCRHLAQAITSRRDCPTTFFPGQPAGGEASCQRPVLRVDGYVRVSNVGGRAGPRFISPALQRDQIRGWAARRDAQVLEIFEELDESGARRDRPLLQQAIARVESVVSQGVVVAVLDRFGRSLVDSLALIDRIQQAGGVFVSVQNAGPAVSELFRRRADGESITSLCRFLERAGVRTPYGQRRMGLHEPARCARQPGLPRRGPQRRPRQSRRPPAADRRGHVATRASTERAHTGAGATGPFDLRQAREGARGARQALLAASVAVDGPILAQTPQNAVRAALRNLAARTPEWPANRCLFLQVLVEPCRRWRGLSRRRSRVRVPSLPSLQGGRRASRRSRGDE
jgi:DNA invertase Pin-like site-specific DNA recombinase